jgi:hypothetical protein
VGLQGKKIKMEYALKYPAARHSFDAQFTFSNCCYFWGTSKGILNCRKYIEWVGF